MAGGFGLGEFLGEMWDSEAKARRDRAVREETAAQMREITDKANQEADKARVNRYLSYASEGNRDAARSALEANGQAVLDPKTGQVYPSYDAYLTAHDARLRGDANAAAAKASEAEFQSLATQRDEALKAIQADAELGKYYSDQMTPEAQRQMDEIISKRVADAERVYSERVATLNARNAKGMKRPEYDALKAEVDKADAARLAAVGLQGKYGYLREGHKKATSELQKSVDAEGAALLQRILVEDPAMDREDPRMRDRDVSEYLQKSLPQITNLGQYSPDIQKNLLAQIKTDEAAGNLALNQQAQRDKIRQQSYTTLLSKYVNGASDAAANAQAAKARLAELIRHNKSKEEIDQARIDMEYWTTVYRGRTQQIISAGNQMSGILKANASVSPYVSGVNEYNDAVQSGYAPVLENLSKAIVEMTRGKAGIIPSNAASAPSRFGMAVTPGSWWSGDKLDPRVTAPGEGVTTPNIDPYIERGPAKKEKAAKGDKRPPKPTLPAGYTAVWDGTEWIGEKIKGGR